MEHGGRVIGSEKGPDSSLRGRKHFELNRQGIWMQLAVEYLHDLPRQLDGIRERVQKRDYPAIKHHAHRAKGTSATYRLNSISKNFAQLEFLAESQNPKGIVAVINEIMQLVESETKRLSPQITSPTKSSERNNNG